MRNINFISILLLIIGLTSCTMKHGKHKLGFFWESADIGKVNHHGSAAYNPETEVYTLKGSGNNMWFGEDEFHFVYRKLKGDMILYTMVEFEGKGNNPHRKAGLIIRESLDPGSPYVSAAYHGDGLVAMQYRMEKDSVTMEFRAREDSLPVLQLVVSGDSVFAQAGNPVTPLQVMGKLSVGFIKEKEYYVGLFVCSHDAEVVEEAKFINTRLSIPASDNFIAYTDYIGARLEVIHIETGIRKIVYESDLPIEAPNWSRDGKFFIVNAGGKLYRINAGGTEVKLIDTGFATSNNNDHGISTDGKQLVISHHAQDRPAGENSVLYTLPISGGTPRQVTKNSPSYWHGWSPDGKYLIYTAKRDNAWSIFRVPATGGEEERLTGVDALDDGSEYSADGKYIWFNSNRTGSMEIWRMKADGNDPVQITHDTYQNWFPHESPNADRLVFLTYLPEVNLYDHPYYKHVMLRMLPLNLGEPVGEPQVIAHLYGGQGTINVPSWSPDGKMLAFVSNSVLV